MNGTVEIVDDADALASALADLVIDRLSTRLQEAPTCSLVLAGGSTPRRAYELLSQGVRREAVDWSKVEILFGDERCVPPTDPDSNYRMARESLFDRLPIASTNILRMRGEADPAKAASEYAQIIVDRFGNQPRFDVVLLGMGPDGHTASLFPGSDPFAQNERLARALYSQSKSQWRLTLTPRALNSGSTIAIALAGSEKAAVFTAIRRDKGDPVTYPITAISPTDGQLIWLIDRSVAA